MLHPGSSEGAVHVCKTLCRTLAMHRTQCNTQGADLTLCSDILLFASVRAGLYQSPTTDSPTISSVLARTDACA